MAPRLSISTTAGATFSTALWAAASRAASSSLVRFASSSSARASGATRRREARSKPCRISVLLPRRELELALDDRAPALQDELHLLAGGAVVDHVLEGAAGADDLAVEPEDEVVGLDARLLGRAPGEHAVDVGGRRARQVRVEEPDPRLDRDRLLRRGRVGRRLLAGERVVEER